MKNLTFLSTLIILAAITKYHQLWSLNNSYLILTILEPGESKPDTIHLQEEAIWFLGLFLLLGPRCRQDM